MLTVEFHCHTRWSKDCLAAPQALLAACRRKRIDRLVVTDHNTIAGALQAQALDPQRVIVGEEIMTHNGELLAAFVGKEIPPGLPPLEAIARLRDQGAFISVSHPFDRLRKGHWSLPDLLEIAPLVDAIETFNARCLLPAFNARARAFARQHHLPGTAGSDAHTAMEIGQARMLLLEFQDARSLRAALQEVRFQASPAMPWVHLFSRYAVWYKRRYKLQN
jgi:predicted metal-dependent phosphoesterase TrpH